MGSGEISTPLWIKCVYGFVCFLRVSVRARVCVCVCALQKEQ